MNNKTVQCELCKRDVSKITKHHLIPKALHHNKKTKRDVASEKRDETVKLCSLCHRFLHIRFGEKELAKLFNTVESMLEHPDVVSFCKWLKKKPDGFNVGFTQSKKKKR